MIAQSSTISVDLKGRTPPAFIAVEGAIGVGKTTLANKLAASFNYATLLEAAEENPFLEKFYRNREQAALATQLFFLFQLEKNQIMCCKLKKYLLIELQAQTQYLI